VDDATSTVEAWMGDEETIWAAARELDQVFCPETERNISNDWVVRYENRWFQLERSSDYPPRQAKVPVCEWEDGRIEVRYRGKARPYREIAAPVPSAAKLHKARPKPSQWKPPANHPWRKSVLPSPSVSSIRPPAAAVQALR
jgi:hypothetical protein